MVEGRRRSGVESSLDGGWGWVIVGCCFMVTVCTRAVTRCISIFFVEFQAHFGADYSATAWIHSLVDCTTMLCAPVGSLVGNRWSCRVAVMLGGLLSSCGLLLSSFSTSLEVLYLTMGVLTGVGFALCYTPSIVMVGCYFRRRRALAYGIAMSGSGIGTFVLAPAVQLLIDLYSWRGALLVLSAFVANLCVCGALLRPIRLREGEEEAEPAGEQKAGEDQWTRVSMSPSGCKPLSPDAGPASSQDAERAGKLPKESVPLMPGDPAPLMPGDPAPLMPGDPAPLMPGDPAPLMPGNPARLMPGNPAPLMPGNPAPLMPGDPAPLMPGNPAPLMPGDPAPLMPGDPAPLMPGDPAPLMPGDPAPLMPGDPAPLMPGDPAPLMPGDPAPLMPGDPAPLMPGDPAPLMQRRRCFSSVFLSSKEFRFLLLPDFLGLAVSFLFLASGCSLPFVYLVPYALSAGVRHHQAAFLMSLLGVLGIVGNITFGWLTDRRCVKPYRLASYVLAVALEGLCCLFTPLLRSFALLVPFAVLYGYFDGAYVALIPVVTLDVVGAPYLSSALGVVYFLHAIPYLISPPIGGWLVDVTGSYTATFFLSGASLLSSAVVLSSIVGIRRCRRRLLLTPAAKS